MWPKPDTGMGIAAEYLPHVFEMFSQEEDTMTREHRGLGLGLAIVRHIIEMHGGTLDLQSEVGVGTVVTVGFLAERIVPSLRDTDAKAVGAA